MIERRHQFTEKGSITMKKLCGILTALLLTAGLAVPAMAVPVESVTEPPAPTAPSNPRDQLPDPNNPEAPDTVVIMEGDVPLTFIKVWNPEKEEYEYILDEEVPLGDLPGENSPQTGETYGAGLALAAALAAGGVLALRKGRKAEEP